MTKNEFELTVTALQTSLYRVARSYLRGEHDCLDAVSEAICKAWQKLPSLRDEARFKTWLTRILIRECINIQRRQKRITPVETVAVSGEAPADAFELMQALDALPHRRCEPRRCCITWRATAWRRSRGCSTVKRERSRPIFTARAQCFGTR